MFRKIKECTPVKLNNTGKTPFASRFQRTSLYAGALALSLGAFGPHPLTSGLLMGSALAADTASYTPVIKHVTCDHPSKEMVFTQNLLEDFKKTMPAIPEVGSDELAYQEVDGLLDDLYGYRGEHGKMINKTMF